MASNSLKKVRRKQKLDQDSLIILLDKQDSETHHQDDIIERKEKLYSALYDSEQSAISHTDPNEVPEITSWDVEESLRLIHVHGRRSVGAASPRPLFSVETI